MTPSAEVTFKEKVTNKPGTEPKPEEATTLPDTPTEALGTMGNPKDALIRYETNSSIEISSNTEG